MKIRKVLVICGLLISVTASTFNVSAATARAAKDCTGTITLAKTSGTFKVTENNTPSNPVTAKKINGSYTSIDILGNKNTQQVTGSLAKGQLSITKYAPSHYSSYMGTMVYYLGGAKGGSVTKYY